MQLLPEESHNMVQSIVFSIWWCFSWSRYPQNNLTFHSHLSQTWWGLFVGLFFVIVIAWKCQPHLVLHARLLAISRKWVELHFKRGHNQCSGLLYVDTTVHCSDCPGNISQRIDDDIYSHGYKLMLYNISSQFSSIVVFLEVWLKSDTCLKRKQDNWLWPGSIHPAENLFAMREAVEAIKDDSERGGTSWASLTVRGTN